MSSRRPSPPPADLWRKLGALRAAELCHADWQRHLGSGFSAFSRFLEPLRATVAATYPDPQSGLPLIPRRAPDGTFTAFPDDPSETAVVPVEGLSASDVLRHRIQWDEIGALVAAALDVRPHREPGPLQSDWLPQIGTRLAEPNPIPVLLALSCDQAEILMWCRTLRKTDRRFFVLLCHDPAIEELMTASGHDYAALDRDTEFVRRGTGWSLRLRTTTAPPPATSETPPLPWTKTPTTKVRVDAGCNLITFPDDTVINLRKRPRCRAFLCYLLPRCEASGTFDFDYQTVLDDYNATRPSVEIHSDRLNFDLFRNAQFFPRLFETIDSARQRFRLLIRRR
jgi:hypothetical protein